MKRTIPAKPKKITPAAPSMRARLEIKLLKLLKRHVDYAPAALEKIATDRNMDADDMRELAQNTLETEPPT